MKTILFENARGIVVSFRKARKFSYVQIGPEKKGKYQLEYKFKNISGDPFTSPYISWENLTCCLSNTCDEKYLQTAVQRGKKLFAGLSWFVDIPYTKSKSRKEAEEEFAVLCKGLPEGVYAAEETLSEHDAQRFHAFICRTGKLSDYYNIEDVFACYEELGIHLSDDSKNTIRHLCDIEIRSFGEYGAPYKYFDSFSDEQFIVTGLLLGYPLESTAAVINYDVKEVLHG